MRGREVDGVTPSRRGGNRRPRGETRGTRGDERRSKTRSTPQDARSDAARRLKSARGSTRWARWATPRPSRPVRRGAGGKPADATYPRIAQPTMMDGTGATGAQWMGKSSDSSVVDHHSAAVIGEYARHRGLVRIGKQSKTKGDFEREWEFLIRKEHPVFLPRRIRASRRPVGGSRAARRIANRMWRHANAFQKMVTDKSRSARNLLIWSRATHYHCACVFV